MGRILVGTSGWCGLHPRDFARHYDVVEFNWTFHERDSDAEHYRKVAGELREMHLHAVLKVSGLATHERRLRSPGQWWPHLWMKYSELQKAGVLGGLLWQLAPSHRCTRQTLSELDELAKLLPRDVLHVFEFRHSSWYGQYREDVISLLRRWGFCMAWINIKNSDGWCGDLEDGWPSMARTCNTAYLRLFGTKQKAIGRYGEEVLRDTILPMVQGPGAPKDSIVIFAQADVPNHAKADASFMAELLGRGDSQPGRSTKWERDVLVATLGLGIGTQVSGVVQRITHKTVFIDIGRSCRAFLDANHARRAGLLESLRIGTHIQNLEVQHLDFQGEWGIVGLSCHKASVSLGAVEDDQHKHAEVEESSQATARVGRWPRQSTETSSDAGSMPPAAQAVAALTDGPPQRKPRWTSRCFEGLAEIGKASGSRHVDPVDSEQVEEQLRAKRLAAKARREERVGRWARALVEKAITKPPSKRSRSEGPVARTRKEEAVFREELKKDEAAALGRAEKRKGEKHPEQENWSPDLWAQAQVLPGEPSDGPIACSVDEFLLMQMECREGVETGCDAKNSETFGTDSIPQGWTTRPVLKVQERVVERRMWRPTLPDDRMNRNKIRPEPTLSEAIGSFPMPTEDMGTDRGLPSRQSSHEKEQRETPEMAGESDADSDWQVCESAKQALEEFWEEEMEKTSDVSEEDVAEPEEKHEQLEPALESAEAESRWSWVPRLRAGSWADESEACMDDTFTRIESADSSGDAIRQAEAKAAEESDKDEVVINTGPVEVATHPPPASEEGIHIQTPELQVEDPQPKPAEEARVENRSDGNQKDEKHQDDLAVEDAPSSKRRAWRGRGGNPVRAVEETSEKQEMAESSEDEIVLAEQLMAEAEEDEVPAAPESEGTRHTARCIHCGMAYSLNVDMSEIGDNFSCQDLGRSCDIDEESADEHDIDAGNRLEPVAEDGTEEDVFVAVCDECGATHVTHIDFMGLGLNFNCGMLGARCEGAEAEEAKKETRSSSSAPTLPSRSQLHQLSADEKRDLFERYAIQRQEERVSKKHINKSIQQLAPRKGQQERYRDNDVVTRKGERFIKVDISLDPGPGCELGGIIGWRTKQGRRGLGIKKMTKEEADKVCISNKNRSHTTKTISAGEKKVVFENKWSKHTAGSMQVAPSGSLR